MRTDISNATKDKKVWNAVGKEATTLIKAQMTKGSGVTEKYGKAEKFKDVSPQYAKYRKPTSNLAPKKGSKSKRV